RRTRMAAKPQPGGMPMLSRRRMLIGTAGVAVALGAARMAPAQPRKRLIVDSQIHMWPANTPERPWVPGTRPQLPEPFTIERVVPLIDEAGGGRVVGGRAGGGGGWGELSSEGGERYCELIWAHRHLT